MRINFHLVLKILLEKKFLKSAGSILAQDILGASRIFFCKQLRGLIGRDASFSAACVSLISPKDNALAHKKHVVIVVLKNEGRSAR